MLGKLMAFVPDPLKWVDDLFAVMHYGFGHKLEWYVTSAWRGAKVERTLLRHGIPTYRRDYGHGKDTHGVHVPKQQAEWADWLLRRAGCPMASDALSNVKPGAMPKAWADERPQAAHPGVGLAGAVLRMFSRR